MLTFVGAGPGAVDLITVRGAEKIKEADTIIYAGSLVNPEILTKYAKKNAEIYDSSRLTLEEVMEIVKKADKEGKNIVRLHTGEPSIYGAVKEQMDELEKLGIKYESVPGVSACFGAAASLNMEFTLPDISQSLIITRMEGRTSVPEGESIESFAAHRASMAIYLSSSMLDKLSERLINGGYDPSTPAAVVYKASWEDERKIICDVGSIAEAARKIGAERMAVILVGDAVKGAKYSRSKLYDPEFETGFRKNNTGEK